MPRTRLLAVTAAGLALLAALLARSVHGAPPTRVRVTLAAQGGGATPLHGVDAELALPRGAVVEADAVTGRVAPAALRLEGGAGNAVVEGRFTRHARAPSVRLLVASLAPLRRGPVVSVVVAVPGGVPAPSAFELAKALVAGEQGAPVAGAGLVVAGVAAEPAAPAPAAAPR
jgi:hypothetical protein